MVLADFGRAVALAAIPIAYFLGVLGIPVLYAVGLVVGILTVFFDVAYQACLVRLIRRDQLAQGNSVLEGSRSAAQIGGPALGGALISLLSAPIAVVAGSFFFLLSFVSIQTMRRRERPAEYGKGCGGRSMRGFSSSSGIPSCGLCVWPPGSFSSSLLR
jgi:hypothetical protein